MYDYGIDRYISNDSDDECTIAANQLPIPVPMKQLIVDEIEKKNNVLFCKICGAQDRIHKLMSNNFLN